MNKVGRKPGFSRGPGLCEFCGLNKRARTCHGGKTYFRKYCHTCADNKYKDPDKRRALSRRQSRDYHSKYKKSKMFPCSMCQFFPVHSCQMDWDHKDGNRLNNSEENRQLLCANCHRLKTVVNKEYDNKRYATIIGEEGITF